MSVGRVSPLRAAPIPQPGAQRIDAPYPLSLTDYNGQTFCLRKSAVLVNEPRK